MRIAQDYLVPNAMVEAGPSAEDTEGFFLYVWMDGWMDVPCVCLYSLDTHSFTRKFTLRFTLFAVQGCQLVGRRVDQRILKHLPASAQFSPRACQVGLRHKEALGKVSLLLG